MNNSKKIVLFGGVILFMLFIVWLFSSGGENGGNDYFSSSNWNVKYQPFDKNPRGTYLFHRLLQTHTKGKDMYVADSPERLDSLMHMNKKHKTYVFVGNIFGLEPEEIDSVMADVQRGSDIFLSFHQITDNVLDEFFDNVDFRSDYDAFETVYTPAGKYHMINLFQKDTVASEWLAFGEVDTKGDSKALSSFMEMDNFIEIKMGKGKAYLHTNPNMFYNYQLKRRNGFGHAVYVMSYVPKYQDVVLLELGRLPDNYGDSDADDQSGSEGKEDRSYLRFILENPPLRTALFLLIGGVLLYVIFRSRRKHPVVPYLAKKRDMTLAFAETITSIYFSKRNPYGLLQVQRKNFYATIQKHFFVDLNRRDGDRELITLSEKSNKPLEEIKEMVRIYETKEASKVTDQMITEIAKRQRAFYKDVGIITDKISERVKKRELVFRRGLLLASLLVFLGLLAIFGGLYLLVMSKGVGIALWPVGIVLVLLGVFRFVYPYLIVTPEKIIHYSDFGRKKVYNRDDVIQTQATNSGVAITLRNNKKLIINYWDMSRFDREQFERFIAKVHTLEL